MALIKSISGIRGTIGGKPGESLSPLDIVKFSAAYGTWIKRNVNGTPLVVTGRDARQSGPMVSKIVIMTLRSLGINIVDLGMAATPTVELAVTGMNAAGGIIITASHNPSQWNALKLLNDRGEFLSARDGETVLRLAEKEKFDFSGTEPQGTLRHDRSWNKKHIDRILKLSLVDVKAIRKAHLTVALDCINSVGGIILPQLLRSLGVSKITGINLQPDGNFAHDPEPLPHNLKEIGTHVAQGKAHVGFVVDPDVDRLAVVCEDGTMFGEEYTLVSVADYVLRHIPGPAVSNLSSTAALRDVTEQHGCKYFSSPVGEVNVVEEMKRRKAVIGGEGNGGVIFPELHYGRDALVGIALFLSHMARENIRCSELRKRYPDYIIVKKKEALAEKTDFRKIIREARTRFKEFKIDERDGMRIDTPHGWVLIRKSNTEPIIRIYAEGKTLQEADNLSDEILRIVKNH